MFFTGENSVSPDGRLCVLSIIARIAGAEHDAFGEEVSSKSVGIFDEFVFQPQFLI